MTSPSPASSPASSSAGSTGAPPTPQAPPGLPPLRAQADLLVSRGLTSDDTITAAGLHAAADRLETTAPPGALLAVHPRLLPPSRLAPLLRRTATVRGLPVERAGFVVVDMPDVDEFAPAPGVDVPDADVYAVTGLERGDEMANWSPEEATPEMAGRDRSPLTLAEGIHWVLQRPGTLEPGRCFMTVGSRLRRHDGTYDARTPALWISGGTGRDGRDRRGAPKVGWCWWRNRHTWLGFASAAGRIG